MARPERTAPRPDPRPAPRLARPRKPRSIAIIGGGIAGLATAGLLARDGHAVQLLEQGAALGGRAGRWESEGFRFDTGPSWYLMPEVIDHWFRLMGSSAEDELELVRLGPAYRTFFEGEQAPVDVPGDRSGAIELFDTLDPGSGAALARYLDEAADAYDVATRRFLYDDFSSLRGLASPEILRRVPRLARLVTQTLDARIARRFGDRRERQILGYPAVFLGTTPFRAPALYQLMSHLDLGQGVVYPQGGFAALVDAMERLAREAGAQIHLGARATRIITGEAPGGARVEGVEWTDDGGRQHRMGADVVVGAVDLHHLETELLPHGLRSHSEASWAHRDPGPGAVLACLGVRGGLPELAHHNLFFTRDWRDNFGRIARGERLPHETSLYVSRTSATDPDAAPAGDESLFVLVPSPARPEWGRGGLGGSGAPAVESVVDLAIRQISSWARIPDLRERVVVRRTLGPADFAADFNAWRGGALGLAHTLAQSAFLRPGNASRTVAGLLYAGASVRPGIGVPMCLISAEIVLKRVRGDRSTGPVAAPPGRGAPRKAGTGVALPGAVLPGAVLPGAVLPGTVLPESVLPGAVLPGTVLPGTVLPESGLPESALPGAALPGAALPAPALPAAVAGGGERAAWRT